MIRELYEIHANAACHRVVFDPDSVWLHIEFFRANKHRHGEYVEAGRRRPRAHSARSDFARIAAG
jgi:hypothetical protein